MKHRMNHLMLLLANNVSFLMVLGSATCFSVAGFFVNRIVGLIVTGIVLILLALILSPSGGGGD